MATPDDSPQRDMGGAGGQGGIWLNGDVLACTCPDCGGPMSIRLWLLVADCFRCGASLELTHQQEAEARRLLDQRHAARAAPHQRGLAASGVVARPASRAAWASAPSGASPTAEATAPPPAAEPPAAATTSAAPAASRRVLAAYAHRGPRARIRQLYEHGAAWALWRGLVRNLPAWLVSLVLHLVAMLILGLWWIEPPPAPPELFLSTAVSYQDLPGEAGGPDEPPPDAFEFDDPGAIELLTAIDTPGAAVEPRLPARIEPDLPEPIGSLLSPLPQDRYVSEPPPVGRMLQGRDPALRAAMVEREGGTSFTEAAVTRGLEWICRHQFEDGRWSLHDFESAPGCEGQCSGPGAVHSDVAATALALLPLLGAGQTHTEGPYSQAVFRGLRWLTTVQGADGDLQGPDAGRMYAHGLAAIVLSEAYALTGDQQLRDPAQKALDFIVKAQHPQGGWRYEPRQPGDTSVIGWQLMALRSGRMGGLRVPKPVWALAEGYLDRAQTSHSGARYAYLPGGPATPVMTAEALLCRQYSGWPADHPGLVGGVRFLMSYPPDPREPNVYYWYYASQVLHHIGGDDWRRWNARMRTVLVDTQETQGHAAGSWDPRGAFARQGGRLYMTSLAVCTLEVYYRHLPLYHSDPLPDEATRPDSPPAAAPRAVEAAAR